MERQGPSVAASYSATGGAWAAGPGPIYERLAQVLVDESPFPVTGLWALDVGAGTGAATRVLLARGARVIAVDFALGMLAHDRRSRPPSAVADARALPLPAGAVDLVVGACSYNHLTDPVGGLREARRVARAGGGLLASAYAAEDAHPANDVVEAVLSSRGWTAPPDYSTMRRDAIPRLATAERLRRSAVEAGWSRPVVHEREVAFPELTAEDLARWRLGMAHTAPFVGALEPAARRAVVEDATARLADAPPLVRRVLLVAALA
jgi:SAM-dependent methyltransferase